MSFSKANDLKKAEKLVQQGKIAAAIKEYSMLVAANPNDITLVNTLGDLCVREGRIDEAIISFLKIGESYSRNGFTLKAIAMYKKIYKLAPSNLDIALKLAELYAKQGLAVDARKQYMEVADAYNRSGRPQNALDIFRKVADLDPENIQVRLKLAESYQREGLNEQALEAYVAAGTQLLRKANFAEAQPVFLKVLEINPVNKLALNSLATIYIKQGEPQKAVSLLTQASQANPEDIDLIILMGRTFLSAELLPEAEQAFLTLLEADKSRFEYLLQLSHKFVDAGQYDRAVNLVEICLDIMISRRQETRGVEILESVAELDPHHIHAWESLSIIYSRLNEERELIRTLNGLTAAAAYHNNMPVAKKALYELLELDPEEPTYRQRLRSLGIPEPVTATLAERDRVAPTSPLSPGVGQRIDFEFAAETPQPTGGEGFPGYAAGGFSIPANNFAAPPYESPTSGFSVENGFSNDGGFSGNAFGGFSNPGFNEFAPVGGGFPSPFQTTPPSSPSSGTSELQKYLTDADRFASLGLADKAVELLEEAAAQSPGSIEVRLKLKELYAEGGLFEKAADQSLAIADIYELSADPTEAQRFRNEAYSLNPELRRHATQPFVIQAPLAPLRGEIEIDVNGGFDAGSSNRTAPPVDPGAPQKVFGFGYDTRPGFTSITPPETEPAPLPDGFYAGPPHPVESATAGPQPVFDMSAHVQLETAGQPFTEESVIDLSADAAKSVAQTELKLNEELEGVDFFLSQGYNDIARETLVRLSVDFPNHSEILTRLNRLESHGRQNNYAPVAPPPPDTSFDMSELMTASASPSAAPTNATLEDPTNSSDLVLSGLISDLEEALEELELKGELYENGLNGAGLNGENALSSADGHANDDSRLHCRSFPAVAPPEQTLTAPVVEPSRPEEIGGLQDVFDEFKQSLEVDVEEIPDFETHYNLGLAYKDMELYDDAVEEFQSAFRATDMNGSDGQYFQVCNMLGLCFMAKGSPQLAAVWFKRGVDAPGRTEDEYQAMRYDLGLAYEGQGKYDSALEMFETVYAVDINYREVSEKLDELRSKL